MGLIKASSTPTGVVHFELSDIEAQVRAKLDDAESQAAAMLNDAASRALNIEADAQATGHEQGVIAGREEGRVQGRAEVLDSYAAELRLASETLSRAAAELNASRETLEAEALCEVVELSLAIARRITRRQGLIDPAVLAANLKDAMKLVVRGSSVRIAVNPDQLGLLDELLPQLKSDWPTMEHVAILQDASIAPGGCRISTNHGQIDADLDAQLDRIAAELLPPKNGGA